ncbi:MAG: hypothetical protein GXP63_02365 [DPANN group archaeon]|nr:hypothetical protein [DPANN group archaeon]
MASYRVILRDGYDIPVVWAETELSLAETVLQTGDRVVYRNVKSRQKAEELVKVTMWRALKHRGGVSIKLEQLDNTKIWVARQKKSNKILGAGHDVCRLCSNFRACDYDDNSCSVLS